MRFLLLILAFAVLAFGAGPVVSVGDKLFEVDAPRAGAARESSDCKRRNKRAVVVNLDNRKHRHVLDHAWDAIRDGAPPHLTIDRDESDANRRASTRGIPTKPGYDRDEYPPAMSDQGGKGADVRYVRSAENRSAGAVMGNQLRSFCDGQRFRYERRP